MEDPPVACHSRPLNEAYKVEAISDAVGLSEENLRLDRGLYLAEPADVIHNAGADANCLSVVGHDPGFEGLVTKLTGCGTFSDSSTCCYPLVN
ncbi:MAG: hypothetical protein CM1200mP25_3720 [Acidobacteriota bacterium]|nr:MAG: hypothetical protein CM1200mP25_3720 [Acidobacteriota bacterium]